MCLFHGRLPCILCRLKAGDCLTFKTLKTWETRQRKLASFPTNFSVFVGCSINAIYLQNTHMHTQKETDGVFFVKKKKLHKLRES